MGLGDVAGLGEQHRDGVLGGRHDVALRGVDHHHAVRGGRRQIDVVDADAGAADHEQLVGGLEDRLGDFGGRTHDQRVRALDRIAQLVGRQAQLHVDLVAGRCQCGVGRRGEFFSNQDAGHAPLSRTELTTRESILGLVSIGIEMSVAPIRGRGVELNEFHRITAEQLLDHRPHLTDIE